MLMLLKEEHFGPVKYSSPAPAKHSVTATAKPHWASLDENKKKNRHRSVLDHLDYYYDAVSQGLVCGDISTWTNGVDLDCSSYTPPLEGGFNSDCLSGLSGLWPHAGVAVNCPVTCGFCEAPYNMEISDSLDGGFSVWMDVDVSNDGSTVRCVVAEAEFPGDPFDTLANFWAATDYAEAIVALSGVETGFEVVFTGLTLDTEYYVACASSAFGNETTSSQALPANLNPVFAMRGNAPENFVISDFVDGGFAVTMDVDIWADGDIVRCVAGEDSFPAAPFDTTAAFWTALDFVETTDTTFGETTGLELLFTGLSPDTEYYVGCATSELGDEATSTRAIPVNVNPVFAMRT